VYKWISVGFRFLLASSPLSINIFFGSYGLDTPAEPIMALLVVGTIIYVLKQGLNNLKFLSHPLSIVGLLWCSWMTFSSLFSYDPHVSLKYSIITFSQWTSCFVVFGILNIEPNKIIERVYSFYLIPLLGVLIYAVYNYSTYSFHPGAAVVVTKPFYFDHSLFSACISLLIGIYIAKCILNWKKTARETRVFYLFISIILVLSVVFLFSRGAWLSLIGTIILIAFILSCIHFRRKAIIPPLVFIPIIFMLSSKFLSENHSSQLKTDKFSWTKHLGTITNLKDSDSNLERINRYKCAYRMFLDRPIFGFGSGTYPDAFIPYQKPEEQTIISVHSADRILIGRGGSTHSEYLRALSENGLPGFILFLGMVFFAFNTAIRIYFNSQQSENKIYTIGILFSLSTFYLHGLFNNFLHQGELAVLYWISLAFLVSLDSRTKKEIQHG